MGSFNNVCGISNLVIKPDDEVMLFFISEGYKSRSSCYIYDNWSFINYPIHMKYADYDKYELVNNIDFDDTLKWMKENVKPMELGKNEYHDIEIIPEKLTLEKILDGISETRLFYKHNIMGKHQKINKFVILKSIYDEIMNDKKIIDNVYKEIKTRFNSDIKEWEEKFNTTLEDFKIKKKIVKTLPEKERIEICTSSIYLNDAKSYSISYLNQISSHLYYSTKRHIINDTENIFKKIAKIYHLIVFMENNYIEIFPRMIGHQEPNYDDKIKFYEMMLKHSKQMKKEYDNRW